MSTTSVLRLQPMVLSDARVRPVGSGNAVTALAAPLTVADIDVQIVSSNQWRLRDRRLHGDDHQGLLGFVEKTYRLASTVAVFEVMTLSNGFDFFSFTSLQDAVTHVARKASGTKHEHQRAGLAWISGAR